MTRFLWLCGPSGVGKSTVGYELFRQFVADGVAAAYLDFDQIGLCRPAPDDDPQNTMMSAANVAAIWPNFRARGVQQLVASGIAYTAEQVDRYVAAVPDATALVCRLRASPAVLRRRIDARGLGLGPPLAGDAMRGESAAALRRVADQAIADAERMDRARLGQTCVETDDKSVDQVVAAVRALNDP